MGKVRKIVRPGLKTIVALAALLSSPVLAQEAAPLRIATSFEVANMNPLEEGFWMPEFGVGELLMQFRADGQIHPWLAASLESVDDLTWRLTLRDGVVYQNGKPLTAQTVLAAIDYQLANSTAARGSVPESAQFTASGPLEITVTTSEPWPVLPSVLASEAVFLIYDAEAVEAAGDDYDSLEGAGIYTGPYALVSLDPTSMELEANPDYWQGNPALPGVTVNFVADANARILAVQNGEADIALYPPSAALAMVGATPGLHFNSGTPGTGGFLAFMNIASPPFDDVAVRRAVMKGIDYEELAQTVLGGLVDTATGFYSESLPWSVQNYETDSAEAATLLEEAGWTLDGDLRRKDGEPLALNILIYPQQPDLVPLSNALQAQLRPLGIEVSVQSVDDIYAGAGDGNLDWDIAISSEGTASLGNPQNFINRYLLSGERNFAGYDNGDLRQAADELAVSIDPDRRAALLERIQAILVDEDPYAFALTHSKGRVVVNDLYRDYQPGVANFHIAYDTAPSNSQDD